MNLWFFILTASLSAFQGLLCFKTISGFNRVALRWKKELSLERNALLNSSDAARLLDQQLSGEWSYDAQRRIGVVAPLLGVIGTAIQFLRVTDFSRTDMFQQIPGIYNGIACGAFAAVVSQALMFFIHRRWVKFRINVDLADDSTGITQAAAYFSNGLQRLLADTEDRCARLMLDVQEKIAARTERTAEILELSMKNQEQVTLTVGDVFSRHLSDAIAHSALTARTTLEPLERALLENHRTITAAMRETLELHTAVSTTLKDALRGGESLAQLSDRLDAVSEKLTDTVVHFSDSSIPVVQSALSRFSASVVQFTEGVEHSTEAVTASSTQFTEFTGSLTNVGIQMQESSNDLRSSSTLFAKQCEGVADSHAKTHAAISEGLAKSVEVLSQVAKLGTQIAASLELAKEGSGAIERVSQDMKTVSASFETSVQALAESGLPRALDLMNHFTSGVIDLRTQVQNSTEVVRQSTVAYTAVMQSLSDSQESIRAAVLRDIEGITQSTASLKAINTEFVASLQCAAQSRDALTSVTRNLEAASQQLAPSLEELTKNGLPKAQAIMGDFVTHVVRLGESIQRSSTSLNSGSGGFDNFISKLKETSDSLSIASTGMQSCSDQFGGSLVQLSNTLTASATSLSDAVDKQLGGKLLRAQAGLAEGLELAAKSAEKLPSALSALNTTLSNAGSQIDGVGSMSTQVAASVTKMRDTVDSLSSSIDRQRDVVSDWRGILDAIPNSLQVRTESSVKALVAHLAEITAEVGKLVVSIRESR